MLWKFQVEEIAFSLGSVTDRSRKIFIEETEFELSLRKEIEFGDWNRRKDVKGVGI